MLVLSNWLFLGRHSLRLFYDHNAWFICYPKRFLNHLSRMCSAAHLEFRLKHYCLEDLSGRESNSDGNLA